MQGVGCSLRGRPGKTNSGNLRAFRRMAAKVGERILIPACWYQKNFCLEFVDAGIMQSFFRVTRTKCPFVTG